MRLTHKFIEDNGFTLYEPNCWFHIELESRGWRLCWIDTLGDYFIEPYYHSSARIKVDTVERLVLIFYLLTDAKLLKTV